MEGSLLPPQVRQGLKAILRQMSEADVVDLAKTVCRSVSGEFAATSRTEAESTIIQWEESGEAALLRRKVKKAYILKYLASLRVGEHCAADAVQGRTKKQLVALVVKRWANETDRAARAKVGSAPPAKMAFFSPQPSPHFPFAHVSSFLFLCLRLLTFTLVHTSLAFLPFSFPGLGHWPSYWFAPALQFQDVLPFYLGNGCLRFSSVLAHSMLCCGY
jgi:hypothetical protein